MQEENDIIASSPQSHPIKYNLYFNNDYINYESPICMIICAALWRISYLILRSLLPTYSPEFCVRILNSIHGVVSAFLGINQCFIFDWPFDHPEWKTSYIQSFIMTFSFGYFVHDTWWMLEYNRTDKTMMCHHVFCMFALTNMIFKGYSGAQATCALGSMEITNPFLQVRWFLRTARMQATPLYNSTEATFFVIFLTIRIIIGSYLLNIVLRQPKNNWDFIFMSLGIYTISWVFLFDMIKYGLRKYARK
ncbi:TLC domain-containing protein 5-like [Euwallacea fornicatus]|uniref:TLC domain-containing protein 5-like n=1 Tax=Euwallacea fornicatus TaxID=995702 RepID=UPI00338DB6E2